MFLFSKYSYSCLTAACDKEGYFPTLLIRKINITDLRGGRVLTTLSGGLGFITQYYRDGVGILD
jgi:hypothetical protein